VDYGKYVNGPGNIAAESGRRSDEVGVSAEIGMLERAVRLRKVETTVAVEGVGRAFIAGVDLGAVDAELDLSEGC
jgi:hypothetical protein